MPAVSKAQQRFMGMVHAVQKGDMEAPSKEIEKAADSMSDKDAKDYASTSHKGLPNKKENMKITRERLKELVKEVMTEESEYQTFFQKALDKAGKGINDMSDDEKKAFFNKIDSAWNGRGEKNEGNTFGAAVSDAKEKGESEFEVGGEKYKVEEDIATELPKASIPSAVKQKLGMAIDKIKDAKLSNVQKLQLVAQVVDALDVDKTQLGTIATRIRSKMESVTEAVSSTDMDKIKGAVEAAKSFMSVGAELKKLGMKYTFATEPLPIYIIQPTPNNKVAIVNKKYVSKPDFVVGDIAVGVMEGKSIKEESPCWKGYKQVGMKDKGGKQVPNCVPA